MRRSERAAIALSLGLAGIFAAAPAAAWCRTSSCGDNGTGARCLPAQPSDCGIELFWSKPCVGWSLQKDASKQVSFADAEKIFTQAFTTWETAICAAGGTPDIHPVELAPVDCKKHEYNQTKANANIILFHDDVWPYQGAASTLALTTVTYNLDTGEIYDADLEVNATPLIKLTTGDMNVAYDMLSIATHETGHFLGLSHSANMDATMYSNYSIGQTGLRDLTDDDRAGICNAYPPAAAPSSCDSTPRHGFGTVCSESLPDSVTASSSSGGGASAASGGGSGGGCACAEVGATPASMTAMIAALGVLVGGARRRSRFRAGSPR